MTPSTKRAETRCLGDVEPVPVNWLWPSRLALGKLNIIAGQPGLGKSQITAALAAVITQESASWPDGATSPKGSVIFISCEDDAADTIAPRLDAAGANRAKVHIVDWIVEQDGAIERRRLFDVCKDAETVRDMCDAYGDVRLIVIDPVSAYLGNADSHKTSDVRAALAPLQTIAAECNACVVIISHLNKGSADAAAMSRVAGSGAFVAAARSAWIVGPHPQDELARVLAPLKNNIGDDRNGFSYRIVSTTLAGGIETSRVQFDPTPTEFKAAEVLAPTAASAPEGSALAGAEEFLKAELADGAAVEVNELKRRAQAANVSWRTTERAKDTLKVRVEKSKGRGGPWVWSLPLDEHKPRQDHQGSRTPNDGSDGDVDENQEVRHRLPSENLGNVGSLGDLNGCVNGHSDATGEAI